jgi:hypothetical protein
MYKITIEEIKQVEQSTYGDRITKIKYLTPEEFNNLPRNEQQYISRIESIDDRCYAKEESAYAPDKTIIKEQKIEIYTQTVESLDVTTVIAAINKIDRTK